LNASLIEKGYDSVHKIANTPRTDFVGAIHEQVGDFNAAKIQVVARAQEHFLDNVVTGLAVDHANGYEFSSIMGAEGAVPPQRCACRDCEAAVGPLAYLADLLKYTVQHVKNNNVAITPETLADIFHQPFDLLPAVCEATDSRVRQVRLCVEALRGLL